ncbi:NADH dehydrogenase [ubiquinone] 1 subunit C2-like [Tachyglossus aculeatus]|uniref:NADH dehydrogenase [ubiquinone] 1 subunit C2-like n=1 Tax=Tachyglossus aculeatus TaxID=9261 RepID=UPI0018F4AB8A|nr:NADH dehydrogenase [ubiquinone] 1 subunit C2-like [Tachyglossus aculeatus]
MSVRPGSVPLQFLPEQARSLPPPRLNDPRLLYIAFMGYCAGILNNAVRRRPVFKAGLHRQLLYVTAFWCAGYFMVKRENFKYAQRDQDMFAYMERFPEDFRDKEKKTYGEILEPFHPIR